MRIDQHTRYPWDGTVDLNVDLEGDASLFLRIPDWCASASIRVNGETIDAAQTSGRYAELCRSWSRGDRVELVFKMEPELLIADERVRDVAGCATVRRGPLIYCLEQPDNPAGSVLSARLETDRLPLRAEHRPELLEGVTVVEADGSFAPDTGGEALYVRLLRPPSPGGSATLAFIPYYAWSNRGPEKMTVWVPLR